jgi:hypothetical protein
MNAPEHPAERLLRWLERNVTDQKRVGLQPITIVVLTAASIMALYGLWRII